MTNSAASTTWSVKANVAGDELNTEETLYTGLTKAEAYATAKGLQQDHPVVDGKAINYFITRDAK